MQPPRTPRRRDRHGRGVRGPLATAPVPLARSRAQRFDDLVLDAVERLERRWEKQLDGVEFAVEEVPLPQDVERTTDGEPVPLGRTVSPAGGRPARVVVYRRPVEARAPEPEELALLVHDVVVEQVADLLGRTPEEVDPRYGERDAD